MPRFSTSTIYTPFSKLLISSWLPFKLAFKTIFPLTLKTRTIVSSSALVIFITDVAGDGKTDNGFVCVLLITQVKNKERNTLFFLLTPFCTQKNTIFTTHKTIYNTDNILVIQL